MTDDEQRSAPLPNRRKPQQAVVSRLVSQLKHGIDREESFRQLFFRYYRLLRRYFRNRGFGPEEAEDLVQETFIRVGRGIAGFRGDSSFDSWLFRIAENTHREHRRRASAGKRSATEVSLDSPPREESRPADPPTTEAGPLEEIIGREQTERVRELVDGFPEQMRQCARLRLFQELRYEEIAAVLQISVSAVKVQLFRARQRLRAAISDRSDEPGASGERGRRSGAGGAEHR